MACGALEVHNIPPQIICTRAPLRVQVIFLYPWEGGLQKVSTKKKHDATREPRAKRESKLFFVSMRD